MRQKMKKLCPACKGKIAFVQYKSYSCSECGKWFYVDRNNRLNQYKKEK